MVNLYGQCRSTELQQTHFTTRLYLQRVAPFAQLEDAIVYVTRARSIIHSGCISAQVRAAITGMLPVMWIWVVNVGGPHSEC